MAFKGYMTPILEFLRIGDFKRSPGCFYGYNSFHILLIESLLQIFYGFITDGLAWFYELRTSTDPKNSLWLEYLQQFFYDWKRF